MTDEPGRKEAIEATDPHRLMPGEDPDTPHADDAEHWIEVYRELMEYKDRLLAVTRETLDQVPDEEARREVAETDQTVITAERDRFSKRLAFWTRRLTELRP